MYVGFSEHIGIILNCWAREGQHQSDKHWNIFKGRFGETSETRWSTYVLFRTHRYHLELNFVGQVKANSITRQVTASYTTEELKAEIQITLPESYPLGGITVDAQRHAVVKQAQWERMLLQLNVFLQHQVCVDSVCVCVCVCTVCVSVAVRVCVYMHVYVHIGAHSRVEYYKLVF